MVIYILGCCVILLVILNKWMYSHMYQRYSLVIVKMMGGGGVKKKKYFPDMNKFPTRFYYTFSNSWITKEDFDVLHNAVA